MQSLKFLPDAALKAGDTLVVSDLHLGIEYEYWRSGIKMPSQTKTMVLRLDSLIRKSKAKTLLINGDFKHKVPGSSFQEEREIPDFLKHFQKTVAVEIVQGNHDADLQRLLPDGVKLHPSTGVAKGSYYYCHGHAWPDQSFQEADYLITGHVQPQIEIRDKLGYVWREPVWVRSTLVKSKVRAKFGPSPSLPELIIIPSFNRFAGGVALNQTKKLRKSPILSITNLRKAEITMLDGTYLGELSKLSTRPSA